MARTNTSGSNKWPKLDVARRRRRRRSNRRESTIVIIDRLLAGRVPITINGETTKVPAAQAIVLQLLKKGMAGSARAWRALLKYKDFANRRCEKRLEVAFVDGDYTRAFANSSRSAENDGL
jgi:hypothetical protein